MPERIYCGDPDCNCECECNEDNEVQKDGSTWPGRDPECHCQWHGEPERKSH